MKRKLASILLLSAFVVGTSTLTSCKDTDSDSIASLSGDISDLQATLEEQVDALEATGEEIDDLEDIVDAIANGTYDCTLISKLNMLQDSVEAYGAIIEKYQVAWDEIEDISEAAYEALALAQELQNSSDTESAQALVDELKEYVDERDNYVLAQLDTLEDQVSEIVSAYEQADQDLSDRIDDLEEQLASVQNLLENKYASLITSINIDKVSNPVFGSLNLPFGIKSTVLCAFYGENSTSLTEFPTTRARYYANEDQADWELVDGVETADIDEVIVDPYAGTLMLTINPSDINYENVKMSLASRGDDSNAPAYPEYFTLVSSDKDVTTRSADNGAYDAVIYVSTDLEDLQEAQIDVNETEVGEALVSILKKVYNTSNTIDALNVAQTLYSNFKSAIPQYYAVKAEWNDGEEDRSVRSDYELAAVTAKPLSYNSLLDLGYTISLTEKIPAIEELGWTIEIDEMSLTEEDTIFTITIENGSNISIEGDSIIIYAADDDTYYIESEEIEISGDDLIVYVTGDQLSALVDQFNETLDSVEDQINDLIETINENYIDLLNNYLTTLTNNLTTLENYLNNPNKFLQPVLFYCLDGSYGRLSQVESAPSVFDVTNSEKGVLSLVATSYTAELVAPAYKKWVQVKAVDGGGSATISDGDNKGEGILIDGGTNALVLSADAGTTYEIVYSAVDYYGYVAAKKYYVKIK